MILYLHMFVNKLDFPAQSQIQINYREYVLFSQKIPYWDIFSAFRMYPELKPS